MSSPPRKSTNVSMLALAAVAAASAITVVGGISVVEGGRSRETVDAFHVLYYDSESWKKSSWLGVPIQKLPFDLMTYQEILFETKPDVLIEAGTYQGGSAYFFASLMDLMGHGAVITIDIVEREGRPDHPRITYISGSSTSPETVRTMRGLIPSHAKVMVVLDSDHSQDHVSNEIETYRHFVTPGQYMVVEDSNINGHPALPSFGPGPMEAIDVFLSRNDDFVVDSSREKHLMTFFPRGFLRKKTR